MEHTFDLWCILIEFAGAALLAPMINPYDPSMTKEEMKSMWENWVPRRKLLYFLARRFPKFLSYFYRRSFLSGKHDRIDNQLFLSLGKKVSHCHLWLKYLKLLHLWPQL